MTEAPHVVMAVGSPIAIDSRVRKTARSVRDMGYRVTVLYAREAPGAPEEEDLDGIRVIGLPVAHHLRDWGAARDLKRAQRPVRSLGLGYPTAQRRRVRAAALAAAEARLAGAPAPLGLAAAKAVHRLRSKVYSVLAEGRRRRLEGRRGRRPWRAELGEMADLEAVFTPWMDRLRPDILHAHDIHPLGAAVNAKRRAARAGRPVKLVYDAHEYVAGLAGPDRHTMRALTAMEAELIREADGVVTVSDQIADRLMAEHRLAARPTVVVNAPPLALAGAAGPTVRDAAGLAPDVPLAVYSGVLQTNRNLATLIRATAMLDGVHLALVCVPNTQTGPARDLARLAAEAGAAGRVHLVEPVAPERVVAFLAGASVGVNPMAAGHLNHELTLPNKLFECLWAGVPVAVSDVGAMAAVVRRWDVGTVFDPADPASMAAAIQDALEGRDRYALAARSPRLRETWAWEAQAARLGELYGALVPLPDAVPPARPAPPGPEDQP
ncbi:MAG: glycosyltransferase family 4 protein [Bifidobacteriaceae bacterium]|nr:glycosyltransferase family 4 protein [Bifidobacteriaceae bacterium]